MALLPTQYGANALASLQTAAKPTPQTFGPQTTQSILPTQIGQSVLNSMVQQPILQTAPVVTGGYTGAPTVPVPQATAITPGSLTPEAPYSIVAPPQNDPYNVATLEGPPQLELTDQERKQSGMNTELGSLYNELTGKTAFQSQQERQFGVDMASATINDLGSQLTRLKNEALAIPIQLNNRAGEGTVMRGGLDAEQNKRVRDNAIQALGVSSLMAAAQGQLANAQSLADRAVKEKYGPIEEKIGALKQNLQLIIDDPLTSLQDKNRALKQQDIQDKKAATVAAEKERMQQINSILIEAAKFGADTSTLDKIKNSGSLADAISNSGGFLSTETKMKQQQQAFENNLAIKKYNLDVRGENRMASAANIAAQGNKLLSIADAKALGVPYGTTVAQAAGLGITPGQQQAGNQAAVAGLQTKIGEIDTLLKSPGINAAVGPNGLSRSQILNPGGYFSGSKQNFIAGVQQLTNQETLDTILNLKKAGGTLGALSDSEGALLRSATSKINSWVIPGKNGTIAGYNTTESAFKKELQTIKDKTQKALVEAQGYDPNLVKPEDIAAVDSALKANTPFNAATYFKK